MKDDVQEPTLVVLPGCGDASEALPARGDLGWRTREAEEILDENGIIAWEWDLASGRLRTVGPFSQVCGCHPIEHAADLVAFIHPEDLPAQRSALEHALRNGDYTAEFRIVRQDTGAVVWLRARAKVRKDAAGQPTSLRGTALDVTSSRTMEDLLNEKVQELRGAEADLALCNQELAANREAVEAERHRYTEFFNLAPGPCLITDLGGRIREANLAACRFLGEARETIAGARLLEWFAPENWRTLLRMMSRLRSRGRKPKEAEVLVQRRNAPAVPCLAHMGVATDVRGHRNGIRWALDDRSAFRRAEKSLPQAKQQVGISKHDRIRVEIADDQRVFRESLADVLRTHQEFDVVGEADSGRHAVELARQVHPDVLLMDVRMPDLDGVQATRLVTREVPGVRVIGLSIYGEPERRHAMLKAGAVAYLAKADPISNLVSAILDASRQE